MKGDNRTIPHAFYEISIPKEMQHEIPSGTPVTYRYPVFPTDEQVARHAFNDIKKAREEGDE